MSASVAAMFSSSAGDLVPMRRVDAELRKRGAAVTTGARNATDERPAMCSVIQMFWLCTRLSTREPEHKQTILTHKTVVPQTGKVLYAPGSAVAGLKFP